MPKVAKSFWELLWDYDPNGLLVVDPAMVIRIVNPALCAMVGMPADDLIGKPASSFFGNVDDLRECWETGRVFHAVEKHYEEYDLFVREVIFPIRDESVVACIMVNVTHERRQKDEMLALKQEALEQVSSVVNKQMKVAQEIAGLLGETTAETQIGLLRLTEMLKREAA
jgi:PAS domain S-box-containing protein